jgi:transcriptional regulator with XRE-family HTH domain
MRAIREQIGIPQDKLGVLIGLDESSSSARISRYETGVHEPPISVSKRISQALHVPMAYLYCEDDLLAEIILKVNALSRDERKQLLKGLG